MKFKLSYLFSFTLLSLCFSAAPVTLVLEGKYQNKNILVHNGLGPGGVGFCAKEIKVNGTITTDETNSSAFEIDLAALHLKPGEKVTIEILHDRGCNPKILNPEDLFPKPTFEVLAMNLSPDGLLSWTTKNETGVMPFMIEQFKWNKWVPVGEVEGLGTPQNHNYSFKISLHSGQNKIRIRQKGFNAAVKISKDVTAQALTKEPVYTLQKKSIDFDEETAFEVYDVYGLNVVKGFGKTVNTENLKSGEYYLCYDNSTISFKR